MTFDVGELVVPNTGTYLGYVGRIVVRKPVTVELCSYFRHEVVFGVEFEERPNGRHFTIYYRPRELERYTP